MKRLAQDESRRPSARIAEQGGFTLVELLVTMLVAVVVLGGGTYGLSLAFKQNTEVTDHSASASQGDVGLERLILDLRQAVNGSCGGGAVTGVDVSENAAQTITTLSMCAPSGAPATYTTTVAASTVTAAGISVTAVPVVWTCNTTSSPYTAGTLTVAPETCTRTLSGSGSGSIRGVTSLTLTGLVNGSATPTALAVAGSTTTYTLSATATGSQTGTLSWVGISASLADLHNPGDTSDVSVVTASAPIPVQTGAGLLNYGT
jgi:prepilin-type N-terminal cleavage/methylation domain-containing protein